MYDALCVVKVRLCPRHFAFDVLVAVKRGALHR